MLAFLKLGYNVLQPYGDCFTQNIYYYKILEINTDNTYKVLCVVSDRDDIGISIIDGLNPKNIQTFYPLSEETFDNMFLNAKMYLYKHHVDLTK